MPFGRPRRARRSHDPAPALTHGAGGRPGGAPPGSRAVPARVMHGNALDHAPLDARDAAQTLPAARTKRARREDFGRTGVGRRTVAGPPRADDAPESRRRRPRLTGSSAGPILAVVQAMPAQGRSIQRHAPRAAPPPGHPGLSNRRATTHRRDRARTYPPAGQERFSPDMMSNYTPARRPAAPLSLAGRAADARRRRRRQVGDPRLYCGTNGCPTTLRLDPRTGVADCPICGFARRLA